MRQVGHLTTLADRQRTLIAQSRRLVQQTQRHSLDISAIMSAVERRINSSNALLLVTAPVGEFLLRTPGDDRAPCDAHDEAELRSFQAVTELITRVERAAVQDATALDEVIAQIKALLHGDTDQYLLIGILLEGIAQAIGRSLPSTERRDALAAVLAIILSRTDAER